MKIKVLLGANRNQELVFGEFSLSHPRYWSKEKGNYTDESVLDFSASFDVVKPFNGDDYNLEDYFEGYVECLDKESKYDMCERFDCKPGNWQMNVQIFGMHWIVVFIQSVSTLTENLGILNPLAVDNMIQEKMVWKFILTKVFMTSCMNFGMHTI